MSRPTTTEAPDLRERGLPKDGQPQVMDRRLFVQLVAYDGCPDGRPLARALKEAGIQGVVYEDVNDARGVAIVTMSEDPEFFPGELRKVLNREPFIHLTPKPALTMIGRTYSSGFEPDLADWILERPRRTILNPAWPWAVWYPLRRTGAFMGTSPEEQGKIMREHGGIGRSFGDADYAHDIRLACHGLDQNDNDFVIGLVGKQLYPLSAVVQAMRKTIQTSQYMEKMGPFFVGRAVHV